MPTQLLIIGASVRAAAQSAARAGHQVIGSDLFADRDLAAIGPCQKIQRYPGEFLRVLRELPNTPWMYTGGLENYPKLIDRFAQIGPLWGNDGSTLRKVRDPQNLARLVHAFAETTSFPLRFPQTITTTLLPDAPAEGAWLFKPHRGSGGLGVRPAMQIRKAPRRGYWQRQLRGSSQSAAFLSANRRCQLLGVTRQYSASDLATPQSLAARQTPFAYAGSLGPYPVSSEQTDLLAAFGNYLSQQAGLVGLWGADFIVDENGQWWLLEINPRYTASMELLEESLSLPLIFWQQAAIEQKLLPEFPTRSLAQADKKLVAKGVLYASQSLSISDEFLKRLELVTLAHRQPGIVYSWPILADIPSVGQTVLPGLPVCSVFTRSHLADSADRKLRQLLKEMEEICQEFAATTPIH